MPTRYIPRPDADFSAFAAHFAVAFKGWWVALGRSPAALTPLNDALAAWNAAFAAHNSAQALAHGARQNKDAARRALEAQVRPLVNLAQPDPAMTNADRAAIGITVRHAPPALSPAPTTRPTALVQCGQRLRHTLRITDASTPTRRARPHGTIGAEVYAALVDPHEPPPKDPKALRYLALVTGGEAVTDFAPMEAGKTAVYMLRWLSSKGRAGPWSEPVTATVAA
jgi:hypothetical protein